MLDLVAEKSGWKKPRGQDEVWGLALHESFNSVVGEVAQSEAHGDGSEARRASSARSTAASPSIRTSSRCRWSPASATACRRRCTGAITLKDGEVEQGNFDDYPVLRINQMPAIEVHILPSTNKPTGVGEPGTPVIAPALANALALANGKPVRSLPLSAQGITLA